MAVAVGRSSIGFSLVFDAEEQPLGVVADRDAEKLVPLRAQIVVDDLKYRRWKSELGGDTHMTSAIFMDFKIPPLCLHLVHYRIQETSLTSSSFGGHPHTTH